MRKSPKSKVQSPRGRTRLALLLPHARVLCPRSHVQAHAGNGAVRAASPRLLAPTPPQSSANPSIHQSITPFPEAPFGSGKAPLLRSGYRHELHHASCPTAFRGRGRTIGRAAVFANSQCSRLLLPLHPENALAGRIDRVLPPRFELARLADCWRGYLARRGHRLRCSTGSPPTISGIWLALVSRNTLAGDRLRPGRHAGYGRSLYLHSLDWVVRLGDLGSGLNLDGETSSRNRSESSCRCRPGFLPGHDSNPSPVLAKQRHAFQPCSGRTAGRAARAK